MSLPREERDHAENEHSAKRPRIELPLDASISVLQILFRWLLETQYYRDTAALASCSRDFLREHHTDVWDVFWNRYSSKYPMINELLSFPLSLPNVRWRHFVGLEEALYYSGFFFSYSDTRKRSFNPTKSVHTETQTSFKLGFGRYHGDYHDELSFLIHDDVIRLKVTYRTNKGAVKSSLNMIYGPTMGWKCTRASMTAAIVDEQLHKWIIRQECYHSEYSVSTMPDV
jgi:hypothetical protein